MFARLEEVRDALYPAVTSEGLQPDTYVPDKDVVDNYLKILREEAKALGTDAPKVTQLDSSMDVAVTVNATARAERTQVLMGLLHDAGLDGQPMLDVIPDERVLEVDTNGHVTNGHSTNGHVDHDQAWWDAANNAPETD